MRERGCVGEAGTHISIGQWRIAAHDFCGIKAISKIVENAGHCYARAGNAGPSAANCRINTDVFMPIHDALP